MVSETKHTVSAVFLLQEHGVHMTPERLEAKLKSNGVAKGTVCKMRTVLQALRDGTITTEQVTSLNAAYNLVKPDNRTLAELLLERGRINILIDTAWLREHPES